jgi:hypothetical protein
MAEAGLWREKRPVIVMNQSEVRTGNLRAKHLLFGKLPAAAPLIALVLLSGLTISLYAVFVHQFTKRGTEEDAVQKAALLAVSMIESTRVEDQVFGSVGLCDLPADSAKSSPVVSLNSVYATLRLDHEIAQRLELPYVDQLVAADIERVHQIESRLRRELITTSLNRPGPADDYGKRSLYGSVNDLIDRLLGKGRLIELKITLGSTSRIQYDSGVKAPARANASYVTSGHYRADLDVPLNEGEKARFYQLAPSARLCSERSFHAYTGDVTPSMVLIEATFAGTDKNTHEIVHRQLTACAIAGGEQIAPQETVFMVSFPNGNPPGLGCLQNLLRYPGQQGGAWKHVSGRCDSPQWQLTSDSNANNNGTIGAMALDAAAQRAFYHWLRSQSTNPSVAACERLCLIDWLSVQTFIPPGSPPVDPLFAASALTKDTGARREAFMQQTGVGGAGLPVLRNAFAAGYNAQSFPTSAFPLTIDRQGNCNLAGRIGFDGKLVQDFLQSVYGTNLASIESLTVAHSVVDRMNLALKQIDRDSLLTSEELTSVTNRLGQALAAVAPPTKASELDALRRSQSDLKTSVQTLSEKQVQYTRIRQRAQNIMMNAEYAARVTFDLSKNLNRLARDGVFYTDHPRGFLLSHNMLFVPKVTPCTEDEVYAESSGESDTNSWASSHFSVQQGTTSGTIAEDFQDADGLPSQQNLAEPRFIIFDSRQLASGSPLPLVLPHSPFTEGSAGNGTAVFYASDAVVSGSSTPVGWSLLIRDLVNVANEHTTVSSTSRWCAVDQFAADSCPELALEVQIRSPVPLLPDLPLGSSVTNPQTQERVSQIPPMPPSMF